MFSTLLIIGLIIMAGFAGYEYYSANYARHDSFGLHGEFKLYKNGQLVVAQDQIIYTAYATVICKLWNDSTACVQAALVWANQGAAIGNPCVVAGTKGGTSRTGFYGNALCSFTGVALSTDTNTPAIGSSCPAIITTNGMGATTATTQYIQNTQQIVLTASWTATGSQSFSKACLIAHNDITSQAGPFVPLSGTQALNAFAIQLFTTQSVTNGQTWTAQWTFSF